MKRILGIVAVVLIVGAPTFGVDSSSITYTLQAGGNNNGWTFAGLPVHFDSTGVTEPPAVYPVPTTGDHPNIFTWSARVEVAGSYMVGPTEVFVAGAANLVWDLELRHQEDGKLVGEDLVAHPKDPVAPGFGIGSASTMGYFSNIMADGTYSTLFVKEPAAFPWVFDTDAYAGPPVDPLGRIWDPAGVPDGPGMEQYSYPATCNYFYMPAWVGHGAVIGPYYDTGSPRVTAPTGTLKGMGAGYVNFDLDVERPGVGLLAAPPDYCYQNIGAGQPIAEGQINMTGLAAGTYELRLVPGVGNNVLWIDPSLGSCVDGSSGAFARAATSNGSTLVLTYAPPITQGTITVDSQDGVGGNLHMGGASLAAVGPYDTLPKTYTVDPGDYTVYAQHVVGYVDPAPVPVTVSAGVDSPVTLVYVAKTAPVITAAVSRRTHGSALYPEYPAVVPGLVDPTFDIPLNLAGTATVEPRGGSSMPVTADPRLIVTFDKEIGTTMPAVTLSAGTLGTWAKGPNPNQLTIHYTGSFAAATCVTATMTGVNEATNEVASGALHVCWAMIYTDVVQTGASAMSVDASDIVGIQARSGRYAQSTGSIFLYDTNCNGKVDASDIVDVKARSTKLKLAAGCPACTP